MGEKQMQRLRSLLLDGDMKAAPVSRKFVGDWSEVIIGIGKDHVAYLSIPDESLEELLKLTRVTGENYA